MILAIPLAAAIIPVNPSKPAMSAMTKKAIAHPRTSVFPLSRGSIVESILLKARKRRVKMSRITKITKIIFAIPAEATIRFVKPSMPAMRAMIKNKKTKPSIVNPLFIFFITHLL